MTLVPLTDCWQMLGIDAKTLRKWLQHAHLPLATHPTDARLKCLTMEQVQQLAALHARPLVPQVSAPPAPFQALGQAHASPESEAALLQVPTPASDQTDLIGKLSCLETQVTTLQAQVSQLALEVLQERSQRYERRLSALETLLPQALSMPASGQELEAPQTACSQQAGVSAGRRLHPAELQARSRLIPLIEYGAAGQYVVICPKLGELALVPDSAEWFEWFATLSSFRFVGQQGRFTAYRDSHRDRPSRSWRAHRVIHQRRYRHTLGVTDQLTITCLEQAAAALQVHLASL